VRQQKPPHPPGHHFGRCRSISDLARGADLNAAFPERHCLGAEAAECPRAAGHGAPGVTVLPRGWSPASCRPVVLAPGSPAPRHGAPSRNASSMRPLLSIPAGPLLCPHLAPSGPAGFAGATARSRHADVPSRPVVPRHVSAVEMQGGQGPSGKGQWSLSPPSLHPSTPPRWGHPSSSSSPPGTPPPLTWLRGTCGKRLSVVGRFGL